MKANDAKQILSDLSPQELEDIKAAARAKREAQKKLLLPLIEDAKAKQDAMLKPVSATVNNGQTLWGIFQKIAGVAVENHFLPEAVMSLVEGSLGKTKDLPKGAPQSIRSYRSALGKLLQVFSDDARKLAAFDATYVGKGQEQKKIEPVAITDISFENARSLIKTDTNLAKDEDDVRFDSTLANLVSTIRTARKDSKAVKDEAGNVTTPAYASVATTTLCEAMEAMIALCPDRAEVVEADEDDTLDTSGLEAGDVEEQDQPGVRAAVG